MAHMTREFSLVLLGTGILTAGYFLWPDQANEEALLARADRQAQQQVAGGHNTGHRHVIVWVHGNYGATGGRPAAAPNITRGGFGSFGHASS